METKVLLGYIFELSLSEKYPDIHLTTDSFPMMRNHSGEIFSLKQFSQKKITETGEEVIDYIDAPLVSREMMKAIIIELTGYNGMDAFMEDMELDTSYQHPSKTRYRVNCYMDTAGFCIAMRQIPSEIPSIDDLNLGSTIKEMCSKSKGLILVTGPTGSGKSTNLAAMIDYINDNFAKHIITIEDPVEFAFENKKSLINQRQIGNHTKGFPQAIKAAMREDPDVIVVGEMRDAETIKAALTLAETGHLVLSTLHTNDTVQSIDRIVDVFPGTQQDQIRMQLAMSLVGIISQRLLPRVDGAGRIPAREILVANDAVRNLVITAKTHQIYSVIEVSSKHGMILMDKYLIFLYKKGFISKDTLLSYGRDREGIELLINED